MDEGSYDRVGGSAMMSDDDVGPIPEVDEEEDGGGGGGGDADGHCSQEKRTVYPSYAPRQEMKAVLQNLV